MEKADFNQIIQQLDEIEQQVKVKVEAHPVWDRSAESIADRLGVLAAWMHDRTHNHICQIDEACPVYRRSMLRRIRRALKFEQ